MERNILVVNVELFGGRSSSKELKLHKEISFIFLFIFQFRKLFSIQKEKDIRQYDLNIQKLTSTI